MKLLEIVDDAWALADSVEAWDRDEATFIAGRIACIAIAFQATDLYGCASRVIASLQTDMSPSHADLGDALLGLAHAIEAVLNAPNGRYALLDTDADA